MTFGKGQQRKKRAAPFRAAGTKTSRKRENKACNQVQQEVEAVAHLAHLSRPSENLIGEGIPRISEAVEVSH